MSTVCTIHAPKRPVVVYDGECRFCLRQVERMQSRDADGAFDYAPRQQPGLVDRFPQLTDGDFDTGMRLVHVDGTVSVGADAVYHIARQLRGWRRVAWLYRVPGLGALCRVTYAWIARNRYRFSRKCADGVCRVDQPGSHHPAARGTRPKGG